MTLSAQLVPQELAKLRLTSQPLSMIPSQFLVAGGQGTQPPFALQVRPSFVQLVSSPHRPSAPQVCAELLALTQRLCAGMHSVAGAPPEPALAAPPEPRPPLGVLPPPAVPIVPPPPSGPLPPPPPRTNPPLHK